MTWIEERFGVSPERAWGGTVLALVSALVVGALAFPRTVYDRFLWQYFWGPVVADAHGVPCVQRIGGETTLIESTGECATAAGIVASPGYTTLSTVSYAVVLLLMLVGLGFLLHRLDVGHEPGFFYALFPFVLSGGALRTLEDANVVLLREGSAFIPFPWTALIISPFIYFTMFAIALVALVASVELARRGFVERYEYPLAGAGTVLLVATLATLGWLAATTDLIGFHPIVLVITLGLSTAIAAVVWWGTQTYAPEINVGTGFMGAVIVWGHAVDGVANVLGLDWAIALGLPSGYAPKHVVNRFIVETTGAIQPPAVSAAIGTAWPFLFVKVAAALFVVWVFNDEVFEDSPRFTMILVLAVLAVGLGPGTRDMLRAAFGI